MEYLDRKMLINHNSEESLPEIGRGAKIRTENSFHRSPAKFKISTLDRSISLSSNEKTIPDNRSFEESYIINL
jgi:hypothetical protein